MSKACGRDACCVLIAFALLVHAGAGPRARADGPVQVLELSYTPVTRAQLAIWVEDAAGAYLATVALTEAVAYRGIGNRPGASEMNSGYRWPYGRREGALAIWAHRRAGAPGARLFPRVIFQSRAEGAATRSSNDYSPDAYYCLQFDRTKSSRDQLDAVSCASKFNSDKGRYLTAADVTANYVEPWEEVGPTMAATGQMQPLPLGSLYPPRMDALRCTDAACFDHPDVERFVQDAREVMPEIDAVTRATAPGDMPQRLLFSVPSSWPPGDYVAWIEVNVEGDYDDHWNSTTYPTPHLPDMAWDLYATMYGYPYRGQPSIVYEVPFSLGSATGSTVATASFAADTPAGRSSWDVWASDYGRLEPVSVAVDDPAAIVDGNGSGADRLRRDAQGHRFSVQVKVAAAASLSSSSSDAGTDAASPASPQTPSTTNSADAGVLEPSGQGSTVDAGSSGPVGPVERLSVRTHPDKLRSHTWVVMRFDAASSELPLHDYDVRVATRPIVDEASFIRDGRPAKNATDDIEGPTALMLPTDVAAGQPIEATIGDLVAQTHYYVAVRATDALNRHGAIRVAQVTTTAQSFATVTPCFVATAAYGSALASEVGVLRRVRDRYLASITPGRALIAAYYAAGPAAAQVIARHAKLRALVRCVLAPLVAAAKRLA
jgi:hypothetical protein